uniref:Ubiquitin-like protease family profile domain-containing protein n=1 Tax=Oryza rufipogon TaxID=4529 RepID=A0A0E0R6X5_ORYRU
MGYHTPTNYSTHATEYENLVEQPTDTRHFDHKFGASQCTPTKFNGAPAGDEFWEASHQLAHFTGPEVVYDVSDSHMMYAVAGDEFWEASHQLAHFTGPEVVYDVSDSHMIPIPVHLFKHYVLYVFNMESKKVSVLDSLNTQDPLGESRFTRHDKIKIMDPYYLRRQFLIHLLALRDNEAILPEYVVHRLRHIKYN